MLSITEAAAEDAPLLLQFILELAEYEKLSHAVVGTATELRRTLFGVDKYARAVVARLDEEPVGFALYFFNYSTFLARPGVYLEDLYVRPAHRSKGIGKALLKRVASEALRIGAGRLEWAVLDWNEPAIGFYRKIGAVPLAEWTVFRLTGEALDQFGDAQEVRSPIPVLRGPRVFLRRGVAHDAERITELLQEPEIEANLAGLPWPFTIEDARAMLASIGIKPNELHWLILLPDQDVVGAIHLSVNRRHSSGYLGFWLGRPYWGQGLMAEAIATVLDYAFGELDLARVAADHFAHNPASGRAMEKAGMKLEGTHRGAYRKGGIQLDAVGYGITRADRRG
jgi:RimJ/RimL family protein N-acetyltransferase